MPEYVENALQHFHHFRPKKPQDQPHLHVAPRYGANEQHAEGTDTSPTLNKKGKIFFQEVVGTFLYYAQAVDCMMLAALRSIATQHAKSD